MFGTWWFKGPESKPQLSRGRSRRMRPQRRRPRIPAFELLEDRTLLGFEPPVSYPVGLAPVSVAVGDFNGDGFLDLAVANSKSRNVSVLLGNGDFTFQPALNYDTGGSPSSVTVGNFRGAGQPLDLVTANPDTNTVSVLLGNGNGTFQAPVNYAVGLAPFSVAVGDFNGDGKLDIVTANSGSSSISVLLGNGDGTFQKAPDFGAGSMLDHSGGFDAHGDLTANGSAQFVQSVARLTDGVGGEAGTVFSNARLGIGKFSTTFTFRIYGGTNPPADGITFIIQGNSPTALGPGGGGLGYGPDHPGPDRGIRNSIAVKFDIFDNAGEGDNSTGLFSDGRSPTVPEPGSGDVLVDLHGTGIDLKSTDPFQVDLTYDGTSLVERITDLVTAASFTTSYGVDIAAKVGSSTAYVGFGGGTGGLTAVQDIQTWQFGSLVTPTSVAVGDFNGDGRLDIVTANSLSNSVSVLLGNGDGTFQPAVNYAVGGRPSFVAVGDFNGDLKLDLVTANSNGNSVSVLLGNGDGTFQTPVNYEVGSEPTSVVVDDFNKDGNLDLVTANSSSNNITVLLGNGDGSFRSDGNFPAGPGPVSVAKGDFGHSFSDPSGWDDVATSNITSGQVSILVNNYCTSPGPSRGSTTRDGDPMRQVLAGAGQDAATGSLDAFFQHAGDALDDVVRLDGLSPRSDDGTGAVDHIGDDVDVFFSPRAFGHSAGDSWFRSFFDLANNSLIDGLNWVWQARAGSAAEIERTGKRGHS